MLATKSYREEEDSLTDFVDQHCFKNPHVYTTTGRFIQKYLQFCKNQGVKEPLNSTNLGLQLQREHKVIRDKKKINGKSVRIYSGIEVQADDEDA